MILILILKRGTNLLDLHFHSSLMSYDIIQGDFLEPDSNHSVLLGVSHCQDSGGSGPPAISLMPSWLGVAWCCSVLLSIARRCSALLSVARQCSALSAALCCAMLHSIARCCIPLHSAIPWHCSASKIVLALKYHYFNMTHLVLNFFLNAYHSKRMKLFKGLIYSTKIFMLQ